MQLLALYVGLLATQTQKLGNFSMDKQATAYLANEVKASCCWDKWLSQKRKGQLGTPSGFPGAWNRDTSRNVYLFPVVLSDLTRSSDISKFQQRKPLCQFIIVLRFGLGHFCVSQQAGKGAYLLLKNTFFHGGLTALVPSGYQEMLFLYCPSMVNDVNIRPSARMGNADMTQGDVCFKQRS